ncbi:MAG: hypothetical protein KatS3mg067_0570 [Thermosynechococcus sp.]|uniref:hypothetical protein n=1 Tax=Thermosynechococcus sp. TaxID=2814275 RepID=UPI002206D3EA|nr:hypothetical protein [Thermosynechococcus sp.]BCX11632.1 MAG: hypothetical protein KatS3mg067_0570 [Thermosynechococcus sp.]
MFNWWDDLLASIEAGIKAGIESGLQSLAHTLAPLLQVPEATAPFQRIAFLRAGVDQPIAGSGVRVEGGCLVSGVPLAADSSPL